MQSGWHSADRASAKIGLKLAPGLRGLVGLLLMIGGVFGFLPILGFWMIPVGVSLILLDLRLLRARRRKRKSLRDTQ